MLGLESDRSLAALEEAEKRHPSERKHVGGDKYLYGSQPNGVPESGPALLADFGCSKEGPGPYYLCSMPLPYQPPEGIMTGPFSYSLDIWGIGITVSSPLSPSSLSHASSIVILYHHHELMANLPFSSSSGLGTDVGAQPLHQLHQISRVYRVSSRPFHLYFGLPGP